MSTSNTFANGQTLVSSALTQDALNKLLQTLTLSILGIDPASDPLAYSKVRLGWIAQPAFARADDVVSIRATEQDGAYNKIRDRQYTTNDAGGVTQTDTWTRIWQVSWGFYGPNGFDHARLLKSALTLDFTHDYFCSPRISR